MILLWNEGARRLYGYQPKEVIGRHKSLLHTDQDVVAGLPELMIGTTSEQGKWEGTVERVRKDGTVFTARVVMTVRRNPEGKPIAFLLMSSDITDPLRFAAELIRKLNELELSKRSSQAKSEELTASLKRLSFSVELADGLPSHIATDRTRLLQALRNLLENAIKFTERGAVRVQINQAPPVSRIPWTSSITVPGRSASVANVPGAAPCTSTPATAPAGHSSTVQPVRPTGSLTCPLSRRLVAAARPSTRLYPAPELGSLTCGLAFGAQPHTDTA